LSWLEDATSLAGAKLVDGAAAGPVNAGKPKDDDALTARSAEFGPAIFGRQAAHPAIRNRAGRRFFIDPLTFEIAVDADR
jgi:hypothetical protein